MKFKFHMDLRPVQMMKKFSKTLGDKKDGGFVDAGLQVEFLNYFWVMNLCWTFVFLRIPGEDVLPVLARVAQSIF